MTQRNKQKCYPEEFARQLLLAAEKQKYQGAFVSDKPDIRVVSGIIGVEVTDSIKENIRYGIAQYTALRGKTVNGLTKKKKSYLQQNDVVIVTNERGNVISAAPGPVWGSLNNIKKAIEMKTIKLNHPDFKKFKENNLLIFAEDEELEYIREQLAIALNSGSITNLHFQYDFIYVYSGILYVFDVKENKCVEHRFDSKVREEVIKRAKRAAGINN
ncbi:Uncharacterised protein [Bacillus freudenreichii]|nr:Uncharacterised protein [Bacillus freudenreichii]